MDNKKFKAGLIALVGLPNAGKSTLLNEIIGEKIAIVSPRPQTTRNTIYGIKTTDDYQAIFVDTPGFHSAKTRLNRAIVQQATDSLSIVDVICVLIEAGSKIGNDFIRLLDIIKDTKQPKMLLITKVDKAKREDVYKFYMTHLKLNKQDNKKRRSAIEKLRLLPTLKAKKEFLRNYTATQIQNYKGV